MSRIFHLIFLCAVPNLVHVPSTHPTLPLHLHLHSQITPSLPPESSPNPLQNHQVNLTDHPLVSIYSLTTDPHPTGSTSPSQANKFTSPLAHQTQRPHHATPASKSTARRNSLNYGRESMSILRRGEMQRRRRPISRGRRVVVSFVSFCDFVFVFGRKKGKGEGGRARGAGMEERGMRGKG